MATQQDIARVAIDLEEAEATVEKLRRKRFISIEAGASYSAAKGRIELAQQELDRLNAEWEAEQEALANRPSVEKSVAKDIDAAQKQLEASRKRLTEAATRAQQALVEVAAASDDHNALIAQQSAALAVRGLRLEDNHDHQTGGGPKGARVRGAWWVPVETPALLVWVMHRAAAAALPGRHQLVGSLKYAHGRYEFERKAAHLLAGVPALSPLPVVPMLRPDAVDLRVPAYIKSRQLAEEQIRRRLQGHTKPVMGDDGVLYPEPCEASAAVKAEVEQELKTLRDNIKSGRIVAKYP
ncbi:hypothetical protein [Streptomyces sp. NBC_01264]|uniref:hypothetical protein n=1 Tax=Streptomyces sp. NBC_01264 TaxID=2903804 RepID=UPI0022578FB0|nr:hypothetical protein [Streptomyces sp. NBC_01264]MCX4780120.1 hypothetical protein [Streptomyces sp. NBC_01264]